MIYTEKFLNMTKMMNPLAFVRYLKETGWTLFPGNRDYVKIFQMERDNDFFQVNIPMEKTLIDYETAMYDAVRTVAKVEGKSEEQIFLYLLNPNTDILKIRLQRKELEPGSILMDDAINLYENAKKMLAAAAQDVLHPKKYHRGRLDDSISKFLSECRFGQTEVGSYVLSIVCPFAELNEKNNEYQQLSIFTDEETCANSLTRKVTNRVMDNIIRIKENIDNGEIDNLSDGDELMISANFYEALQGMSLQAEGTELEFSAEWSPVVKNPKGTGKKICFNHDYYEPLKTAATKLKNENKTTTKIIGRIKKLESSPDLEKRKSGIITVVYVDDYDKARTVAVQLNRKDYSQAIEAHENGWYVEVTGEMSGKTHRQMECRTFDVME